MSATKRQLLLLELLENEEYISVTAIKNTYKMNGLNYSKSQFYRDIDFLKSVGYCIENDNSSRFNLNKLRSENYDFLSHYYKHLAMSNVCEQATKLDKDFLKYIVFVTSQTLKTVKVSRICQAININDRMTALHSHTYNG